jgi:hypothetical protein
MGMKCLCSSGKCYYHYKMIRNNVVTMVCVYEIQPRHSLGLAFSPTLLCGTHSLSVCFLFDTCDIQFALVVYPSKVSNLKAEFISRPEEISAGREDVCDHS